MLLAIQLVAAITSTSAPISDRIVNLDNPPSGSVVRIAHASGQRLRARSGLDRDGDGFDDVLIVRNGLLYQISGQGNPPSSITLGSGFGGVFSYPVFGANYFLSDGTSEAIGQGGQIPCDHFALFGPNNITAYDQISQLASSPGMRFCGTNPRFLWPLGDVSGDGIDDLAIQLQTSLAISFGFDRWTGGLYSLNSLLVEGSSGGGSFNPFGQPNSPISGGTPLGDIDGNGTNEIMLSAGDSTFWIHWGPFPLGGHYLYPNNFSSSSFTRVINTPSAGGSSEVSLGWGRFDFNGDGFEDIVFDMSTTSSVSTPGAGRVCVVFGRASPRPAVIDLGALTVDSSFCVLGNQEGRLFGRNARPLGDLNGDGFDEFAAQAQQPDETYIFFGKATGGLKDLEDLTTDDGRILRGTEIEGTIERIDRFDGNALADFILETESEVLIVRGSLSLFGPNELFKNGFETP